MADHGLGRADGHLPGVVAEDRLHGDGLDGVPPQGRGAVHVDVVDHRGVDPRVVESRAHDAGCTAAVLAGGRDVVRVPRHPVSHDLTQDGRPSAACVAELLEDQDPGPFADHEAVTITIEGTRGPLGLVVPGAERPHRAESPDTHLAHGGLGAAGDHGVGQSALDEPERVSDGVGTRGARRARRRVRTLRARPNRDPARGQVHDHRGDEEGADPPRPALQVLAVLPLDGAEASDAAPHDDAESFAVGHGHGESGILDGQVGRRQRQVDEAVHLLDLLLLDPVEGVEALHLAGEAGGVP